MTASTAFGARAVSAIALFSRARRDVGAAALRVDLARRDDDATVDDTAAVSAGDHHAGVFSIG